MSILNYFHLETIEIARRNGTTEDMPGLSYGNFAITPHNLYEGYTVTHIPSGRGAGNFSTLEDAARYIAYLNGLRLDWSYTNRDSEATMTDLFGVDGAKRARLALGYWRARTAEPAP